MTLENALNLGLLSQEQLKDDIKNIRNTFNIPLSVPDEMIYCVVANDILDRYFCAEYVSEEAVEELMGEWN